MLLVLNLIKWIKKNLAAVIASTLFLAMLVFHFFGTYNPPIIQPVVISPVTKGVILDNGQLAQSKLNTPETLSPQEAGFSDQFVKDTINKIMGIKDKQIIAINQINGRYIDSLDYVKEELDEQKRKVVYYESKNAAGRTIGTGKTVDGGKLVITGDLNLVSAVKKSPTKGGLDSLVFYDPDQRFTVNQSKEYKYAIPAKTVTRRWTFGISAGAGVVLPNFDTKKATAGAYVGASVNYNFR